MVDNINLDSLMDGGTGAVILDDLVPEPSPVSLSEKNKSHLAAQAAAISNPEDIVVNYNKAREELDMSSKSGHLSELINAIRSQDIDKTRNTVMSLASDPDVPVEDRAKVVEAYANNLLMPKGSAQLVAEQAALEDIIGETNEAEFSRINTATLYDEVNQFNKYKQSLMNSDQTFKDVGMAKSVANFLEIMAPFAEGVNVGGLVGDFKSGKIDEATFLDKAKGAVLTGSAKASLRDAIRSLPIDERYAAVNSLMEMSKTHKGILFQDDNELAATDVLRTFLDDGYYNDVDELLDNAVGVMDTVLLGLPIFKGLKGLFKTGKKGAGKGIGGVDDVEFVEPLEVDPTKPQKDSGAPKLDIVIDGEFEEVDGVSGLLENMRKLEDTRSGTSPTSVSQLHKDTNPEKARGYHEIGAISDNTAEATHGTNSTDAVAGDLLPSIKNDVDAVESSVARAGINNDLKITAPKDIQEFVVNDGVIYYTKGEKSKAQTEVINYFREALNPYYRDEISSVGYRGNGLQISATYGPADGGFSNAQDAMDLVKFSLRDKGISDENIKLMKRNDQGLYEIVDGVPEEAGQYMVRVDYDYLISPADISRFEDQRISFGNFFDSFLTTGKFAHSQGSITRMLADPATLFDPRISKGASVAVDKSAGMERALNKYAESFSSKFSKLNKEQRGKVEHYIKKANQEGIDFLPANLKADGFTPKMVDAVKDWRNTWDTVYWLNNRDMIKTLKAKGFKKFVDEANETELFAKPVNRTSIKGDRVKYYDQRDGTIKELKGEQLTNAYRPVDEGGLGGTMAKLREPKRVGDEVAEYVFSSEKQGKSYLRGISDTETVLNYRKGYYQVQYKDPWFVDKIVTDSNGKFLYKKAVATAANKADADLMSRRLSAQDGQEYTSRVSRERLSVESEDYWSVEGAGGRINERARGQRLEDSTSGVTAIDHSHVVDPVESLVRSIRNVSRRVSMRDYLESYKLRMMDNYSEFMPKDDFGQPRLANNIGELDPTGQFRDSRRLRDAKTALEYLKYLEDGYVNSIDDAYKAMMNGVGDIIAGSDFGKKTAGKLAEESVRALAKGDPSKKAKSFAFTAYLATNPLRQIIVQSHQAVRLNFVHPAYMATKATPQLTALGWHLRGMPVNDKFLKATGWSRKEFEQVVADYERSGLLAAIDSNNLVRGDLKQLSDANLLGKSKKALLSPVKAARMAGFDAGEWVNITLPWLAQRNKVISDAKAAGRALSSEDADEVTAWARNFTYNMNLAGDMPYNTNTLNVLAQFLQVPHKALLQYTNRNFSKAQRAKLLAADTVMWGIPGGGATLAAFGIDKMLPEDEQMRDLLTFGVETMLLNAAIEGVTGIRTDADFTSLAPNDLHGIAQTVEQIWTSDLTTVIASSPSGQMFFGSNPRLTNFVKDVARMAGYDHTLYEDPDAYIDAAKSFAKISSGMSNYYKFKYALEKGRSVNSMGQVVDPEVSTTEAWLRLMGFGTLDEKKLRETNNALYETSSELKEDIKIYTTELMRVMSQDGMSTQEWEANIRMMNIGLEQWKDIPKAQELITKEFLRRAQQGNDVLIKRLMEFHKMGDFNEWETMVLDSPLSPEEKSNMKKLIDDLRNLNKGNE